MPEIFSFAGLVLVIGGIVAVALWLGKGRCPRCGKLFAGRVVGSSQIASVDTVDFGYDRDRDEYRNIRSNHTGYLIKRSCRFCDNTWERIESTSRQLDRLSEEEAEEYRRRKLF